MKFEIEVDEHQVEKPKATILFDKSTPKESLTDEKKFRIATKGTAEDISRLLNYDYIEYNGIKPSIQEGRVAEIDIAYRLLQQTQRELDSLSIAKTQSEHEYAKLVDAVNTFEVIKDAAETTNSTRLHENGRLEEEVIHIYDLLEQERRRIFVLEHMKVRTRDDIVDIKAVHSSLLADIDKNKSELAILMANLRSMTLDLKMQERSYEDMLFEIESRQAQREEQLQSIKYMVNEGNRSIQVIKEMTPASTRQLDAIIAPREPGRPCSTQRSFQSRCSSSRSTRRIKDSHSTPSSNSLDRQYQGTLVLAAGSDSADLSTLEAQNQFLDEQLAEADRWRMSLEQRRRQLEDRKLDAQTRRQFEGQILRYEEEICHLNGELQSIVRRDVQFKEALESLFQAVPRFLAKLTHKTHQPIESVAELEDTVEILENELGKTLLTLNTSLVSCSAITEGDEDEEDEDDEEDCFPKRRSSTAPSRVSEMTKLHRYFQSPQGVELQSRSFKALMASQPNDTSRNVRVVSAAGRSSTRKRDTNASATASTFRFKKSHSVLGSHSKISSSRRFSRGSSSMLQGSVEKDSDDDDADDADDSNTKQADGQQDSSVGQASRAPALITTTLSFDRNTMKAISNLIVNQHIRPKRAVKVARNLGLKRNALRPGGSDPTTSGPSRGEDKDILESTNNIINEVV